MISRRALARNRIRGAQAQSRLELRIREWRFGRISMTKQVRLRTANAKVRTAVLEKIPYLLVVGERDAANKTISIRTKAAEQGATTVEEFVEKCREEIGSRR